MPYVTEENLTDLAVERWSNIPDPRLRQVMTSMVKHLHGFVSEVRPSGAEWFEAIKFLTATGQMCDETRQEWILLSDTLLSAYSDDEIEVILAHELAHHVHRDLWRGIAVHSIALFGALFDLVRGA